MKKLIESRQKACADFKKSLALKAITQAAMGSLPKASERSGDAADQARQRYEDISAQYYMAVASGADSTSAKNAMEAARAEQAKQEALVDEADREAQQHAATFIGLQRRLGIDLENVARNEKVLADFDRQRSEAEIQSADAERLIHVQAVHIAERRIFAARKKLKSLGLPDYPGMHVATEFVALSPLSAQAAREAKPWTETQGGGWGVNILPSYDQTADVLAFEGELASELNPEKGVIARAFSVIGKAA